MSVETSVKGGVFFDENRLLLDIGDLFVSFAGNCAGPISSSDAFHLASSCLDFRAGRPREDTPWTLGPPLTDQQKQATIEVAGKWEMLETSRPSRPADNIVTLGAHRPTLELRAKYATDLYLRQLEDGNPTELTVLSCFRESHPKEEIKQPGIDNELNLAVNIFESELGGRFEADCVSAWDDLPDDTQRNEAEYGVAYMGHIMQHPISFISGSVPSNAERATTISTLESLKSHLGKTSCSRLLIVTTSLHKPYQAMQVKRNMSDFDTDIVGIAYKGLLGLNISSPDAHFRIVLQEIGATIKNALS